MNYFIVFLVPMLIAFIATPFAKKIAGMIGAIDVPKDDRRMHKKPIPRLGGLAIFIAATISIFIFEERSNEVIGFLVASGIIAIMGIIDDVKELPAKIKLAVQLLAGVTLYFSGIRIEILSDPIFSEYGYISLASYLSFPLTVFWIVGVTNTINLIDGLDGLSAGISAIAGLSMGIVAALDGNTTAATLAFIIAGAAIGFLPYNFNPASIFMGDTGALYLGLALAATSIEGAVKSTTAVAFIIPVLILGLPLFDTSFAMFRRYRNGKPIMGADRGHIHHKLIDLGLGQKKTVLILYGVGITFGVLAIVIYKYLNFVSGLIVLAIFAVLLMAFKNNVRQFMRNAKKK